MSTRQHKGLLLILDGMGISPASNAKQIGVTSQQDMPYVHQLMKTHGYASLIASGEPVGLDKGQAGNSEIGHVTIGAGVTLPSTLTKIRTAYENGAWAASPVWNNVHPEKPFHIVGMLSDAGVHAHWQTIIQAATLALSKNIKTIYIHALLDGVDSQAGSAPAIIKALQTEIDLLPNNVQLVSLMGRQSASDRSGKWEISEQAKHSLMDKTQVLAFTHEKLLKHIENESEQSFPCHWVLQNKNICSNDTVLLTSHRADRISQLAKLFSKECHTLSMVELNLEAVAINHVFFPTTPIKQGLISHLKNNGYQTTRLSEQCKFPHVTYFINGMQADDLSHCIEIETIADEKISEQPEMSLQQLAAALETELAKNNEQQALIVNVPNLDQVGHTGSIDAAKKAASYVDEFTRSIVNWCHTHQWQLMITADHGNADVMIDFNGKPIGSHSINNVPLIAIDNQNKKIVWKKNQGTLANVAASFLNLLNIEPATFMEKSLISIEHQ